MGNHGSMALADQQRAVKLALADIAEREGTAHVPTAVELVAALHTRRLSVADGLHAPHRLLHTVALVDRLLAQLDTEERPTCHGCGAEGFGGDLSRHDRYCPLLGLMVMVAGEPILGYVVRHGDDELVLRPDEVLIITRADAQPAQAPATQPPQPGG